MTKKIVTLAGDGIGPEIMAAGLEVLAHPKIGFDYSLEDKPLGVLGLMPLATHFPRYSKAAKGADALPQPSRPEYDNAPVRPEQGLPIRKELDFCQYSSCNGFLTP